jgi:hypothetical protein
MDAELINIWLFILLNWHLNNIILPQTAFISNYEFFVMDYWEGIFFSFEIHGYFPVVGKANF